MRSLYIKKYSSVTFQFVIQSVRNLTLFSIFVFCARLIFMLYNWKTCLVNCKTIDYIKKNKAHSWDWDMRSIFCLADNFWTCQCNWILHGHRFAILAIYAKFYHITNVWNYEVNHFDLPDIIYYIFGLTTVYSL